jgi:hypothetical protein
LVLSEGQEELTQIVEEIKGDEGVDYFFTGWFFFCFLYSKLLNLGREYIIKEISLWLKTCTAENLDLITMILIV